MLFQSTPPHGERHIKETDNNAMLNISIHAPAWGATKAQTQNWQMQVISIHAPAWGATPRYLQNPQNEVYFNPRSRMGSDRFNLI